MCTGTRHRGRTRTGFAGGVPGAPGVLRSTERPARRGERSLDERRPPSCRCPPSSRASGGSPGARMRARAPPRYPVLMERPPRGSRSLGEARRPRRPLRRAHRPRRPRREAVVTPAVKHVEIQGEPTLAQQWELVRFMAGVLEAASAEAAWPVGAIDRVNHPSPRRHPRGPSSRAARGSSSDTGPPVPRTGRSFGSVCGAPPSAAPMRSGSAEARHARHPASARPAFHRAAS